MKQFPLITKLIERINTRAAGATALLGFALILAVGIGCRGLNKRSANQSSQPMKVFKELKTTGTVTSTNVGGSCAKKINGVIVRSSPVGFSYSVDGQSYTSTGCTYNPQTMVGSRIDVCYNSSSAASAKPCGD